MYVLQNEKRLGGMGQEQHWPRTAVPVLLPTFYSALYISHRATCRINLWRGGMGERRRSNTGRILQNE
jgi:hypothetical protein